mmetsp:Transcript_22945/g.28238  ORF Transcript_22945/g.28238 Transcript_22945/m.28238 type:complete len:101 (-) Transcript_22945:757-1059(-)
MVWETRKYSQTVFAMTKGCQMVFAKRAERKTVSAKTKECSRECQTLTVHRSALRKATMKKQVLVTKTLRVISTLYATADETAVTLEIESLSQLMEITRET